MSVLGTWKGSIAVDRSPVCLLCVHSFFGRAFEKAAEGTNSRTLHNHFDLSGKSPLSWASVSSLASEPGKLALLEAPCEQTSHPTTTSPGPGRTRQLRECRHAEGPVPPV